jgi:two-component system CheB/CheR fusion protein
MSVREASEGMPVRPNHVYVIPPGQDMMIREGHLALQSRTMTEGRHMPVDLFLRTLAEVQGRQSVAVVLSGTGTDGTLGCKAVKSAGGISFAQDPGSARYDGMPRSAIAAGCVDLVLPPEEIARELQRLSNHDYLHSGAEPEPEPPPPAAEGGKDPFRRILALLRRQTGTDFSTYRKPTLMRRTRRRMTLRGIETLEEYARRLEADRAEVDALHHDFLINVTTFFRDPAAFEVLAHDVFPRLLEDRPADAPLRVWVPACATGEEAYSIAICLLEAAARMGATTGLQLFGTDLSAKAIEKARAGVYLESVAGDVSPARLSRFFVKIDGHYQISKSVRDLCVFAEHNIIQDPPFSRLDLVSCRNVLIYLEPQQQRRVLAAFHYALKPSGILVLGSSETTNVPGLFEAVDRDNRVYAKSGAPAGAPAVVPSFLESGPPATSAEEDAAQRTGLEKEADRLTLLRYAPPSVLVNDNLDIIHFRGQTGPYLQHEVGKPSLNLMKMLPKESLRPVREALKEARAQNALVRREVRLRADGQAPHSFAIQVMPVRIPAPGRGRCFLLLFEEAAPTLERKAPRRLPPPPHKKRGMAELEQELSSTRHYQQALLEDQEAANEELQSAHEELLSSNEELQSINEELETAKEELQSSNEELSTLNQELQNRNEELSRATDDMANLLAALDLPILMLAPDGHVRRFTPAAARLFNLIPGDVGRPLADLRGKVAMSELEPEIRAALGSLAVQTKDVMDQDGRWHSLRVRPYKTQENRIEGTVLMFVDIDELKKGADRLQRARAYAEAIVDVSSPLVVLNTRLRVERASRSYCEMFGTTPEQLEDQALSDLHRGLWDVPFLKRQLADLLAGQAEMNELALEGEVPGRGRRALLVNARRVILGEAEPARVLLSIYDRTDETRAAQERERLLAQEESTTRQALATSRLKDEFIATVSHELRGPLNAMAGWVHVLGSGSMDPSTMSRGLAALERAVKAQTRLIEDLLDMSRIISGKLRLAHRFIDFAEVTRAAIETAGPAAEAKSIRLELASAGEPYFVLGDPDRLQQVVWNLVSNAVKFTPREGRVQVQLLRQGTNTELRVTDNGQGISPEFLPHIFEPFRQADSSPARSHQGLGLGLAISRHLVESHGGVIRAHSEGVGRGTSITVLLPVPPLAGDTRPEDRAEGAPPPVVPDATLLDGVRVLIVEDEADSRDILGDLLRAWGADVVTVASGPEALVALDDRTPDVLVSDIGMPGMDGYELLREVRKRDDARGGRVPAIALTAYADSESRRLAVETGFEEHVAKPAEPKVLLAAVARLAGRTSWSRA